MREWSEAAIIDVIIDELDRIMKGKVKVKDVDIDTINKKKEEH